MNDSSQTPATTQVSGTVAGPSSTGTEPRSPEQIRRDIQAQREQLGTSVDALRERVNELTDWRSQLEQHRDTLIKGAAAVGFLVGVRMMVKRRRNR